MKQKILFFDIDGTLIDEETDVVPESAKKALAAAKEKGHLLFICSGRCLAIIPQNVVELGFDGLIGGCGTYIEMEGKEVYHHTLPMELQKEIIKDLEKFRERTDPDAADTIAKQLGFSGEAEALKYRP